MRSLYLTLTLSLGTFFFPLAALAQTAGKRDIGVLIDIALNLVQQATSVVAALALLFFFWGLARFIAKAGDTEAQKEGKQIMLWGVIALFVMVSFIGLIEILQGTVFGGRPPNTLDLNTGRSGTSGTNPINPPPFGPDFDVRP